jgi:hypothetical protein
MILKLIICQSNNQFLFVMDMQKIKVFYDVCVIVWVVSSILKACVALLSKG